MLCSDTARALPGTAVAWNFSGWGTGRHFTPIHDDIPALVTPPLSGFVRQIQAAVPACADLAVRFADVEDAHTLLRVNEVNPAFQNEGDFVASVREKNEYTLLAELDGRVVGFVNYYFMWLSERSEHAGQATAPKVIPQQVVYIATLQSVRQTTHAEYVAEINGTTAPRYTGLLLLLTALRHAMLCGMTAACVDSTEGAASFYRQVCGFTVTGATHMTSPVRNRVGRTGLLASVHAPLAQSISEPRTPAASSRPSAAAPLFQSQITLPKPAPPPQQYPPLAASAAGARPQESPRTPVRQRQGRYVPMTLPLVGVDLYAPFRYRVQAATRARPVRTHGMQKDGVHKLEQSRTDLDIGISSSLVQRSPIAVAPSSSTNPATEPMEHVREGRIGERDDTADYITTVQRLLVAQSLANHHAAERLLERVRAHEEEAEAGAEAAQYEEDMWDSFALRVEQEQMAEEERQRKQEKNQDAHCLVCDGDVSSPGNHIVFCERCDLAVHQQCYGVPVIPDGDWFCDSCAWWKRTPAVHRDLAAKPAVCAGVTFSTDDPQVKANATRFINVLRVPSPACRFCGVRGGAMKPILKDPPQAEHDTQWAHIVCAYALGVTMASDAATGVRADLLLGCRLPSHLHSLLYESPADAIKDEPEIDQGDAASSSVGRPSRHQEQQLEPARVCALCTRPYGLLVHSGRKFSKSLPSESELVHPSCAFMHGLLYPIPPVAVSHKAAAEADAFPRPAIEFRADANTCELAPTWKVVHPGLLTASKRRGPVWREDQRHKAEQERRRARPTTARMKPKQSASTTPSKSKRRGRRQTGDSSDSEESVLDESESEDNSSDQWSSDDGAPRRSRRGRRQRRQKRRARRRRSSKQSSPAINPEDYCDGDICHVCYDGSTVPENSILYCERCSVAAHQGCAGVARVPDGDWLCRVCAGGGDPTQLACEICGLAGGLFTDVMGNTSAGPNKSGGKWCHVLCAIWTPETLFADYRTVRAVQNIDAIDAKRRQLQCKVCRRKGAVSIQCGFGSCGYAFHPTCGFDAGFRMTYVEDAETEDIRPEATCPKHGPLRLGIRKLPPLHYPPGKPPVALLKLHDTIRQAHAGNEEAKATLEASLPPTDRKPRRKAAAPASTTKKRKRVSVSGSGSTPTAQRSARKAKRGAAAAAAPAPPVETPTVDTSTSVTDSDLYCRCRCRWDGSFMLGCDGPCEGWYHPLCVGFLPCTTHAPEECLLFARPERLEEVVHVDISNGYFCPDCAVTSEKPAFTYDGLFRQIDAKYGHSAPSGATWRSPRSRRPLSTVKAAVEDKPDAADVDNQPSPPREEPEQLPAEDNRVSVTDCTARLGDSARAPGSDAVSAASKEPTTASVAERASASESAPMDVDADISASAAATTPGPKGGTPGRDRLERSRQKLRVGRRPTKQATITSMFGGHK